ncbi:MAG: PilN domain-containing protein, partial [Planctomycetota bacterium]
DPTSIQRAVREALESGRFSGRRAAVSLSHGEVEHCAVRMAPMPEEEMESAIRWQAGKNLSGDVDTYEIRSLDAGEVIDGDDAMREMIILGASRRAIGERIALLKECGLETAVVESLPTALARWSELAGGAGEAGRPHVVLHVGEASTLIVIVDGADARIVRQINSGRRDLLKALEDEFQLNDQDAASVYEALLSGAEASPVGGDLDIEEARDIVQEAADRLATRLNRELTQCLRYFSVAFRASPPTAGWIVGDEKAGQPLYDALSDSTSLSWQGADLGDRVDGSDASVSSHGGVFAEALGLASHDESCGWATSFVVGKASKVLKKEGQGSSRGVRVAAAALALLMGLGGVYLAQSALDLRSRVEDLTRQVESTEDLSSELQASAREEKTLRGRVEVLDRLSPRISTNAVLAILGGVMPEDTGLTSLTLDASTIEPTPAPKTGARRRTSAADTKPKSPTEVRLNLVGLAPSEVDVARLVRRMADHPLFAKVNLSYSKPSAHGAEVFREFNIAASVSLEASYVIRPVEGDVAHVD